eukprot:5807988-Amphidinium_carterae.1
MESTIASNFVFRLFDMRHVCSLLYGRYNSGETSEQINFFYEKGSVIRFRVAALGRRMYMLKE